MTLMQQLMHAAAAGMGPPIMAPMGRAPAGIPGQQVSPPPLRQLVNKEPLVMRSPGAGSGLYPGGAFQKWPWAAQAVVISAGWLRIDASAVPTIQRHGGLRRPAKRHRAEI